MQTARRVAPVPVAPPPKKKAPAPEKAPAPQFPIIFSWHYDYSHPISEVWEIVTNTARFNRSAGLNSIHYAETPLPYGGSERHGATKAVGLRLQWLEHPFEWVLHQHFSTEREYNEGPMLRLVSDWRFLSTATGCRVIQTIAVDPKNFIGGWILRRQFGVVLRRQMMGAYAWVEDYLNKKVVSPYKPSESEEFNAAPALRLEILERLALAGVEPELCSRAAELLTKAAPLELTRMRPFRKAAQWRVAPKDALSLFLRGTKVGIFVMEWDLLCPYCRGARQRVSNLGDIQNEATCQTCNISFKVDFSKSVELTFLAHPDIRRVETAVAAVNGPQMTPHRLAQLRLASDSTRAGTVHLAAGVYLVRSLQSQSRYRITVAPEALSPSEVRMTFTTGNVRHETEITLPPGEARFVLDNQCEHEVVAVVEKAAWQEDICTAAYVTSLQEFRSLFATQVLRSGERLAVGAMALLFTDLQGSTAMYERIGDSAAFALVREHFEILIQEVRGCDGAVVKTIGDSVMASFTTPANAVNAAVRIHKRFAARNQQHPESPLVLKIGIHYGACLAVNLNDRMDYFGSAVNVAARTEGVCEGGDVVITHELYLQPGVSDTIERTGWRTERFKKSLKGVRGDVELIRLRPPMEILLAMGPN